MTTVTLTFNPTTTLPDAYEDVLASVLRDDGSIEVWEAHFDNGTWWSSSATMIMRPVVGWARKPDGVDLRDQTQALATTEPDAAVRVCPTKDSVCGDRQDSWCEDCPKRPAPQQATPTQESGVFREYFDAHRALIEARGASERASHAHIVGYRAPSHSTGSEPYETSVTRNDQLKRADDAARSARKEAEARFNAALSAAQSAAKQAGPERRSVKIRLKECPATGEVLLATTEPKPCTTCSGMGYVDGVGDACTKCSGDGNTTERKGEPVTIEAVATVGDCAELRWLVEGGVTALPPGVILLVADKMITEEDGQGEVYTSPQVPEDTARLDWIERQCLEDLVMCLVIDAPNDGRYSVCGDSGKPGYGKTLREAIDAARKVGA